MRVRVPGLALSVLFAITSRRRKRASNVDVVELDPVTSGDGRRGRAHETPTYRSLDFNSICDLRRSPGRQRVEGRLRGAADHGVIVGSIEEAKARPGAGARA